MATNQEVAEIIAKHRLSKAIAIVDKLREAGITADLAEQADDDWWKFAATQAGVRKPSTETQSLVLQLLRGREGEQA